MQTSKLVFLFLLAFVAMAGATQFKVGGSDGWTVPVDTTSYTQWAAKNRFQIGDSLVFVYPQGKDSVLLVDHDAYNTCNTSSYIDRFNDGNSVFTFDRSGSFFFISGIKDNCLKKESFVVVVLANRTGQSSSHSTVSPGSPDVPSSPMSPPPNDTSALTPPSTPVELTPPPPVGESVPAAPPSGEETNPSTTPPPPSSGETNTNPGIPSIAPSTEVNPSSPPPPSKASMKIVGLISSTAPLLGLIIAHSMII